MHFMSMMKFKVSDHVTQAGKYRNGLHSDGGSYSKLSIARMPHFGIVNWGTTEYDGSERVAY